MISVGSRDLGLGFGGRGGGMEGAEVEEGEACGYSDAHGEDASFDPETDLSYIDQRLKNILGHLQKDFEGGVSAENLGAKFGGYGSFLPSCPRSPPTSAHPEPPLKAHSSSRLRPPNILPRENSAPTGARVGQILQNTVQVPVPKVSTVEYSSKGNLSSSSARSTGKSVPKHEYTSKLVHPLDQKSLKVRIKVGPDCKLAQKNAAIYSGLGLDGSPSSSVEDSPTQNGGFALGSQQILGQSPTVILQEMTSIPVPGGCLLSPLPVSFLHLMEREVFQMDTRICFAQKCSEDGSAMASYESPARTSEKGSVDVNNGDPGNVFLPKKEMGIEIPDESCKTTLCHIGTGIEKHALKTSQTSTVWENENRGLQKDVCFNPSKRGKNCINRSNDLNNQKVIPNLGQPDIVMPHQRVLPPSGRKKKSKESLCNVSPAMDCLKENLKSGSSTLRKVKKKRIGGHPSRSKPVNKLFKESEKNRERHVALFEDNDMAEKRVDFSETQFTDGLNDSKLDNADEQGKSSSEKFNENSTTLANPKAAPDSSLTRSELVPEATPVMTNTVLINDDWVCCDRCGKWRLLPYGTNAEALQQSQWLCSMLTWLPGMNRCEISEDETTKALEELYYGNRNNPYSHMEGPASGISLGNLGHPGQNYCDHNLPAIAGGRKKKQKVKEASNVVHSTNLTKKNQQTSLQIKDNVQQSPLVVGLENKANFQNLSKSASIDVANKRYMQKDDTNRSKVSGKREASLDESRASKKIKRGPMEVLDCADGDRSSYQGENTRKVIGSNNGIRDEMVSKGVYKHKYSLKESKCDRNDRLSAYPKKKQDQPQASFNGQGLGNNDKIKISAKKRKVKDRQGSEMCPPPVSLSGKGHNLPNSRNLVVDVSVESEFHKGEVTRLFKTEGKESRASKGESKPNKKHRAQGIVSEVRDLDGTEGNRKGCIVKCRQGGPHEGQKNCSQQTLEGIDSLRRERCGQVSVCTTSSTSKISGSCKSKPKFQDIKSSPVESVSSSPVRLSNYTKVMPARSNLMEKDGTADVGVPIMSSSEICYDGEGNGAGDQLGTMRKEKAFSVHSSIVDNQQKRSNYSSRGKHQGLTGWFSVPESDHMAIACKEQHDHLGDEMVDKEDSFLQCREKHGSSKSFCDRTSLEVSNLSSEQEDLYSTKKTRFDVELDIPGLPICPLKSDGKYTYQENFGANATKGGRDCLHKHSAEKCLYESREEDGSKSGGLEDSDVKVSSCITDGTIDLLQNQNDFKGALNFSSSDRTDGLGGEQRSGKSKYLSYPGGEQEISQLCPQHIDEAQRGNVSSASSISASGDIHEAEKPPKLKPGNRNGAHNRNLRHFAGQTVDASGLVRRDSCNQIASNALKDATDLKHKADRLKNAGAELQSTGLYFRAALKFLYGASRLEACDNESAKPGEMMHSMLVYSDTARLCEFVAHEYERSKEMAAAALAYKCMEVAYMKVIYSKHSCLSRDRHELQMALQMVPPGESPSSSASDIDNLNNQGSVDKAAVTKGVNFSQATGNLAIVARNRPSFMRLLNFAQDVIFAMEAARKSHIALAASHLGQAEALDAEGTSSVKRAIDFNFHDVEGLLRLVRMAMEAINH